ncbi:hypothetical protein ACJIZ3_022055 [Penstemon smallii]|uniref:C2H2-type domain-containing protein n=1 Tax=Penstemon smallii TaxID=265156 RepID=A0ABD3SN59_9LAMI
MDIDQNSSVHFKSYRCTFCKRGFQNAQALGGHMNIHRKDRAKLKEFSSENLLSLDITKSTDFEDNSSTSDEKFVLESDTNNKKCINEKHEENRDIVHFVKEKSVSPLSLHADEEPPLSHMVKNVENKLEHGEVDLELRLGPEPHDQDK